MCERALDEVSGVLRKTDPIFQDFEQFLNMLSVQFQTLENLFYRQLYTHNSLSPTSQDSKLSLSELKAWWWWWCCGGWWYMDRGC